MTSCSTPQTPLALHACCGPCSLMPTKLLREEGFEPSILFCNPNIAPAEEYARRLETLKAWAAAESVEVREVKVDAGAWDERVARPYGAALADGAETSAARRERCRACYRLRFEASAEAARAAGLPAISTTLSVSPYQYTDVIAEELERAAKKFELACHFEDFRPQYRTATALARTLGLYRQNYCGCALSAAEAAAEREERKAERAREKAEREAAERPRREAEAAAKARKAEKRRAYERERARRRAVLRGLKGL